MNVRERPILFSAPMIRALLAGKKTQTRRVMDTDCVEDQVPDDEGFEPGLPPDEDLWFGCETGGRTLISRCPYGKAGDRLWVKETHQFIGRSDMKIHGNRKRPLEPSEVVPVYAADFAKESPKPRWRPSIFMPRWASRLTLEVEAVRVERLHEISPLDAIAEGIFNEGERSAVEAPLPYPVATYKRLWDSINGKRAPWSSNPWVWVVTFKVVTGRATPLDARDARDK